MILLTIDPLTGICHTVGAVLQPMFSTDVGLAFDTETQMLYASLGGGLYVIDPSTGSGDPMAIEGAHGIGGGLAFDPRTNSLLNTSDIFFDPSSGGMVYEPRLIAIDLTTATGTVVGPSGRHRIDALTFIPPAVIDCNNNGISDECETISGGDFDNNGIVDLDEWVAFVDCAAGPGRAPTPSSPQCVPICLDAFDFDSDGDVDLVDFGRFQAAFTGS